jgi:hypothetical protein
MFKYNIFKPHIVKFADGNYAVRKRGWCGLLWVYKDRSAWLGGFFESIMWWDIGHIDHCKVSTFDKALEVKQMEAPNNKKPNEIVEVYYG